MAHKLLGVLAGIILLGLLAASFVSLFEGKLGIGEQRPATDSKAAPDGKCR